jgi:hypothetical protein
MGHNCQGDCVHQWMRMLHTLLAPEPAELGVQQTSLS